MYLKIKQLIWLLISLILCQINLRAQEEINFPIVYEGEIFQNNAVFISIYLGNQQKMIPLSTGQIEAKLEKNIPPYQILIHIDSIKLDSGLVGSSNKFCLKPRILFYSTDEVGNQKEGANATSGDFFCDTTEKQNIQPINIISSGWKKLKIDFSVGEGMNTISRENGFSYSKLINVVINDEYSKKYQEDRYVQSLQKEFSLYKVKAYLDKYPTGLNRDKVDNITWKAVGKTVEGANKYLYFFPQGKYLQTAEDILNTLPKNSVDKAWSDIQFDKMTPKAFLEAYPNSIYHLSVYDHWIKQEGALISATTETTKDLIRIQCKHTIRPRILRTFDSDLLQLVDTTHFLEKHYFSVRVKEPKEQTIQIVDALGQKIAIPIGQPLSVNLKKSLLNKDTLYTLTFKNGFPPYNIFLENLKDSATTTVFAKSGITENEFTLSQQELSKQYPHGHYRLVVKDDFKTNSIKLQEPVLLHAPKTGNALYYSLAGLGLLGCISFFIVQFKDKSKKTETKQAPINLNTKTATPVNLSKANQSNNPKNRITIKRKAGARSAYPGSYTNADFKAKLALTPYYIVKMSKLWDRSSVLTIYFQRKCIYQIDSFLKEENIEKYKEDEGKMPEIGGFLLGSYTFYEAEGTYEVTFEEFVPIASENISRYELEFSTASIVKELGDAQDSFPNLSLIGWFHTHPGHGLFLSTPDLKLHRGFFSERYQIAMEIDSLSGQLDTGFFSWKNAHKMNNVSDLSNPPDWLSWTAIEKEIAQS